MNILSNILEIIITMVMFAFGVIGIVNHKYQKAMTIKFFDSINPNGIRYPKGRYMDFVLIATSIVAILLSVVDVYALYVK